ncbi:MAG: FlgT C-terminal domain-containing protein [Desulfobacteraceae bacterium]|jgi:hypothetical protein
MHGTLRLITLILIISWGIWGCGGSPNLLKEIPTTINTVESAGGHIKLVPVVLIKAPETAVGQKIGELYFAALIDAIRDEDDQSKLMTSQDSDFPAFMAEIAKASSVSVNAVALSEKGRKQGYQGIVTAAVNDIRAEAKKTGFLWLRKTRHFIHYTVTVDLYDPYTGAKIINEVFEGSIKIGQEDYDAYQAGTATSIADLNDKIEDVAQELGELIGGALKDHQWKASVLKIRADRIVIPTGRRAGLKEGDRLAVFESRRLLEGVQGASYIAPGVQVGQVQITSVTERMAEAKASDSGNIKEGDIVIPIK